MHSYAKIAEEYGQENLQTHDRPAELLGLWEVQDGLTGVTILCLFGFVFNWWLFALLGTAMVLIFIPWIKRRSPRGVLIHWPYRHLGFHLPGFVNPRKSRRSYVY